MLKSIALYEFIDLHGKQPRPIRGILMEEPLAALIYFPTLMGFNLGVLITHTSAIYN